MRSIRHSLRLTAGVLAGALLLLLLAALQPAAAQTSTPSVPAATAASATSTTTSTPTPSAPAATPEPTKTLPQLIDTLIKGDAPTETAGQLLGRYSIPLAALVLVAAVLGFFAWRYFSGLGAAVEDVGKTHGSDMLKARAEERERLQAEQRRREAETQARDDEQHQQEAEKQARDSGVAAYLDWLQDELKYLPRIPIRSTDQRGQLLLTEVYVPLRVVEREQIEQYRKLLLGQFDPADEINTREQALGALEQSQRVYQLLSDAPRLPTPSAVLRAQRRAPASDQALLERMLAARPDRDVGAAAHPAAPITCLLLVGDAGSGKTTTLHYGTLALAHDRRRNTTELAEAQLELRCDQPLMPFYIRLTLVANALRAARARAPAEDLPYYDGAPSDLLLKWLDRYTCAQASKKDHPLPADLPSGQIAAGGCLVLLDGLDETGDAPQRDYMQRLIANLAQDYPRNRYIVASRPFEGLSLPGFAERHLSPLNQDEMHLLLRNWFGAAKRRERAGRSVQEQVAELWHSLEGNPRLFDMATNPLLLTSMALLVHSGIPLPRERAKMYNALVSLMLENWRKEQIRAGKLGDETSQPKLYYDENEDGVRRRLQQLAAWMLREQRREIRLSEARDELRLTYRALKPGWNDEERDAHIGGLLELLALHSGLIQRRDNGYSFTHFTLQEYLTARFHDELDDAVERLFAEWDKPRWHETILLAVGHWATSGLPSRAQRLLRKLLDAGDYDALALAATALDEANAGQVLELAPLLAETAGRLAKLAFSNPPICPDPSARNRAAILLDRLGADDDRPGLRLDRADYWSDQPIAPGVFRMGDDDGQYDNEKPAFDYTIRRAYALARYPATNRQYLEFLNSLDDEQQFERHRPAYWPGRRYRPGEGNHPVVGVSWSSAMAFAAWADRTLREKGLLKAGEEVRLPTEPEWECAAAYPASRAEDAPPDAGRRAYPWGDWPESLAPRSRRGGSGAGGEGRPPNLTETPDRSINAGIPANIDESGIGGTSVVGIFPRGTADCGAQDMAGNVWEWCCTRYQTYPLPADIAVESLDSKDKNRTFVLRGGSWRNNQSHARCAFRHFYSNPDLASGSYGLRLAHLFSLPSS